MQFGQHRIEARITHVRARYVGKHDDAVEETDSIAARMPSRSIIAMCSFADHHGMAGVPSGRSCPAVSNAARYASGR